MLITLLLQSVIFEKTKLFEMLRGADIVQGMLDKAAAKGCEARNSNAGGRARAELFEAKCHGHRGHRETSLYDRVSLSLYISLKVEGTIQGHLAHRLAVWKRVQERSGRGPRAVNACAGVL